VLADPGQLELVVLNLAVNARDAMPQGGWLTLRTARVTLDEERARAFPDVQPGPHVELTIADTGAGMDAATRARVFEPFFTTKEVGKGTGLGLATVYGIVKQSGGHISVESEVGRGTTFTILLPVAREAPGSEEAAVPAIPDLPRGTETVLVVEDESAVRDLSCRILRACGYTVLEARNGREAVEVAQRSSGPVHLVVTDLVMPLVDGREMAADLRRERPGIKVLYVTGYVNDALAQALVGTPGVALMLKPYHPRDLARAARELLDKPGP
jgi:CheY-like chemotaxis protein